MHSIERHKLNKKARLLYILAYVIGLGLTVVTVLFLVLVIKPIEEPTALYGILLVFSIITPMFTGLGLTMYGGIVARKLVTEGNRLLRLKADMYYERFCNLIRFKQFDEARDYYNNFIHGHYRVISHGILLGAVLHSGADKDWKDKALDRIINM